MTQPARTKVYMFDDHPLLIEGVDHVLAGTPDLVLCGSSRDVDVAVKDILALRPDVTLLDLHIAGSRKGGFDVLERVRAEWPAVRMIVYSFFTEEAVVARGRAAGAVAHLPKSEPPDQLVTAIRSVSRGMTAGLATPLVKHHFTELQLTLMRFGATFNCTDKEIAEKADIPVERVIAQLKIVREELQVDCREKIWEWYRQSFPEQFH